MIEYKNEKYELVSKTDNELLFRKIDPYKGWSLKELAEELIEKRDELEDAENECSDYNRRVNEFRYCGYTEEDPDFHGMCLHLNELEDEVNSINEKISKLTSAIEEKTENMSEEEFERFLDEYNLDW